MYFQQRKRSYDISSYHWHLYTAKCYNNYILRVPFDMQSVILWLIVRKIVSNVFAISVVRWIVECISMWVHCYARVLYCIRVLWVYIRVWRHANWFSAWQFATFIRNVCFGYFYGRHSKTARWPLLSLPFILPFFIGFSHFWKRNKSHLHVPRVLSMCGRKLCSNSLRPRILLFVLRQITEKYYP